jgi:hypothetical protein
MLSAFVKCAKTVLPAQTSAQWCYQKSTNKRIYDCKMQNGKKVRYEFSPLTSKLVA